MSQQQQRSSSLLSVNAAAALRGAAAAAAAASKSLAPSAAVGRAVLRAAMSPMASLGGLQRGSLLPAAAAAALPSFPPASQFSTCAAAPSDASAAAAWPPGSAGSSAAGSGSEEGGSEDDCLPHLPGRRSSRPKDAREQKQAKLIMEDPLSMLMASRGMPLGMSMSKEARTPIDPAVSTECARAAPGEPKYQMEAIDDLFVSAKPAPPAGEGGGSAAPVDSWGTTKASAEEIARRLVVSNRGTKSSSVS